MKEVLYIHGFNSAKSNKIDFLETDNVITNSISLDKNPKKAIFQLEDYIQGCGNELHLIGMSLGGFYALYLTEKYGFKNTVLINPSVNAPLNMSKRIGEHINYKTNKKYTFTEKDLQNLEILSNDFDLDNLKGNYLTFIGLNDEVVSPKKSFNLFDNIITMDEGHRISKNVLIQYKTQILKHLLNE